MTQFSKEWLNVLEKDIELSSLKNKYFSRDKCEILSDLSKSLESFDYQLNALKLIKDLSDEYKRGVLTELVYIAVYGNPNNLGFAVDIILEMDREPIKEELSEIILKSTNIKIDEGYLDYLYRNIASLLYDLGFSECLDNFLSQYCKDSDDDEVKDLYAEYTEL